tara:strand:+ start:1830 stop:3344 length:1515 start_codon:yes stop_codon:yes gene_type:complete
MQNIRKIHTDYKYSMLDKQKTSKSKVNLISKWPFGLGLLTFAVVWQVGQWSQIPSQAETEILYGPAETLIVETENKVFSPIPLTLQPKESQPSNDENRTISTPSIEMEQAIQILEPENPKKNEIADNTLAASFSAPKTHIEHFTIEHGRSLAYYFQKAKLPPIELHNVLTSIKHSRYLKKIFAGQVISMKSEEPGTLDQLTLKLNPTKELKIIRGTDNKFTSTIIEKPIERRVTFRGGTIKDSLFLTGKRENLSEKLIMELAQIFEYDIDFALDIKPNDHFKVLYEDHYVEGKKIGHGAILTAEFGANNKVYKAIRYTNAQNQSAYYSPKGESLKKAFIRTPVEFTRISSHFNLKRKHPVLHKIRAHRGVDYAAPTGTPVKASGSGKVIFVGRKGGYGNAIILQHGSRYSTLYAHLSKFAKGIRNDKKISQGQVIGYVGSTGLASGPHLHYEFRINGIHKNPLTVPLPNGKSIPKSELATFKQHASQYLALLDETEKMTVATNE